MNWAFTENGFDIFHWDKLRGLIGSLLLTFVQFFCIGVYFLENVFWILIRGVKMKDGSYKNLIDGLLFNNQAIADNQITKITGIIMIIAIALVIVASVIAVIKSQFATKEENEKSPKYAIAGAVKAILLMVIFPLIVYGLLLVTNTLTNAVCEYAHFDNTASNSLANRLFFMFMNPDGRVNCFTADGLPKFSFTLEELPGCGFPGNNSWEMLKSSGFVNGNNEDGLFGYSYFLATVVLIILIFGLFKATLLMVRRVFDVIVLYVIAPLPIACYPSDEGKRFDIWKDLMASKIVSSFGLAITFIIYSILITVTYDMLAAWSGATGSEFRTLNISVVNGSIETGTLLSVVYLFILISGALALPNLYSLLATLVSSQAGMVAHHDLQNMSNDMAFFQRGTHAGGALALGSTGLMLKAIKTAAFGNKDARYLNAIRQRNGQADRSGKLTNSLWNLASGGIIGGAVIGASHALRDRRSGRLDDKANQLRSDAIRNFDDKLHLEGINTQLSDMGQRPVTYRDVLQSETDRRGTARADELARARRKPPEDK